MIAIPLISAICYLVGGQWLKLARWLMGVPIFIIAILNGHQWYTILAILTYFIATNVFSYGDNMWTTKLFGKWISMGLSGLTLGLASIAILSWQWCIAQAILGLISFLVLKYLDDNEILKNPFQELFRGFFGTLLLIFA